MLIHYLMIFIYGNYQLIDLIIYLFEEQNNEILLSNNSINTSRSIGYISMPLFPLARNQTIKGTFPLIDRFDESITSGASIDISIYWQFAYIFDETKIITKTENEIKLKNKKQILLLPKEKLKENIEEIKEEDFNNNNNNNLNKLNEEINEEKDLIKKENIINNLNNNELIKLNNLNNNKTLEINKIEKDINLIKQNNSEEINNLKFKLESFNEEKYSSSDNSLKSEEIIQSPKSSISSINSFEENLKLKKEEEEEDNISIKSDATYTMEINNNLIINNEEINKIKEENIFKESSSSSSPLLLNNLPPIPTQRKSKEQTNNFKNELINKKIVEFSDPLHSSIPPSSISSFTESLEDSSSHSSELNLKEEEELFNEEKNIQKNKKQLKKKREINIKAIPKSSSIKLRKQEEELIIEEENNKEEKEPFILNIFIGKLKLIENSSSILRRKNINFEWNLLDINRDLCETDKIFNLPKNYSEELNFDCQKFNLLKQWTELNIVIEIENNGELDDLCMGEFNLINLINKENNEMLIENITMRDVDNLTIALLEIGIKYSDSLFNKIKDYFTLIEEEEEEEEGIVNV
ncbi:hypothetical protein Mgra_00004665 [Meloidogyne graminicola]|uniref:Uncharacterized protein n=1 Tax=Meloidogyne graminicola TaxID=189291 RepID=A0A8S9ZRQ6_9BILA|nr:hypothetical protein Mgra_00004665 [Meloidogyne graminicola]